MHWQLNAFHSLVWELYLEHLATHCYCGREDGSSCSKKHRGSSDRTIHNLIWLKGAHIACAVVADHIVGEVSVQAHACVTAKRHHLK